MDSIPPDAFPAGIVRLDADERIVAVNSWFVEWSGRTREDLIGVPIGDLLRPVREDLVVPGESDGPFLMRHPDRLGVAAMVSRTAEGEGSLVTLLDATDRYRALRELRRSHALADRTTRRLQLVIDASIAFATAASDDRLADILARVTAEAYEAEESAVLLLDDDGMLRVAAGTNPFEGLVDMAGAARYARDLRDVITVSSFAQADALSPSLGRAMRASGVEAILAAPLDHEGESFGVTAAFFRHPRAFDREAAPLAEALAGQAAQTLVTLRLQARLAHAAMHDETTGLPNRRLLEERMREQIVGERHGRAVLFLDLDGFKAVNDEYGHPVGDEVLREVGRRLQATVREGDIVARYGGDEFVVVCGIAETGDAAEIAERLRAAVRAPYAFLPEGVVVGASVGIALAPFGDPARALDGLIRAADQAMYAAKSRGGDRVVEAGAA